MKMNMDSQMEFLLARIQSQIDKQTDTITERVTNNLIQIVDERLNIVIEENKSLKLQVDNLQTKIKYMETEKKRNNLMFLGFEEKQQTQHELMEDITNLLSRNLKTNLQKHEIAKAYRIGVRKDNKRRPVLVSFNTTWRRDDILKYRKEMPTEMYIKEDFSKEVLEIRKNLLPKLEEERKKGRIAYLKNDKLIVKDITHRDNRKRGLSQSPSNSKSVPKKIIKPNILNYVARTKPQSFSRIDPTKN